MDILRRVNNSLSDKTKAIMRCCTRTFRFSRYNLLIMHSAAVFIVLLFVESSFAVQPDDLQKRPTLVFPIKAATPSSSIKTTNTGTQSGNGKSRGLEAIVKDSLERVDKLGLGEDPKGLFFGEDANGVPIVLGSWFRYGSYTLAFAMFGTAFLVACVASAIYYVLFVVTEPSQQLRSMQSKDEGWNAGRVLRAIQLAYETYETLDPYSPSCQLKTVCEIQESDHFQGSLLKRLAHFIIHTEYVQKRMANAAEIQAADRIGNDPQEKCGDKFPECRFSLDKMYESYLTM